MLGHRIAFLPRFKLGWCASSLVVSGFGYFLCFKPLKWSFVFPHVSSVLQLCLFWVVCLQFLCYDLNLKQLRMVQKFSSVSLHTVGGGKVDLVRWAEVRTKTSFYVDYQQQLRCSNFWGRLQESSARQTTIFMFSAAKTCTFSDLWTATTLAGDDFKFSEHQILCPQTHVYKNRFSSDASGYSPQCQAAD